MSTEAGAGQPGESGGLAAPGGGPGEWSGAEVARDADERPDADQAWSGDQVVRDTADRAEEEPGGWDGGQMVSDDLDQ